MGFATAAQGSLELPYGLYQFTSHANSKALKFVSE